jgi:hypothetical protein
MFPVRNLENGRGAFGNSPLLVTRRSGILLCISRESRACRHPEGKDNATDRNQTEYPTCSTPGR